MRLHWGADHAFCLGKVGSIVVGWTAGSTVRLPLSGGETDQLTVTVPTAIVIVFALSIQVVPRGQS
jgi:hypothetical protein